MDDFFLDGRSDVRTDIIETNVMKLAETIPQRDSRKYYLAMGKFFASTRPWNVPQQEGLQ
jgi:hypothetical protein